MSVSDDDLEKINQKWDLYIENGSLICKKPVRIIQEEQLKEFQVAKDEFSKKMAVGNVKIEDVTNFLSQFILK